MRLQNLLLRNFDGVAQIQIVASPRRQVRIQHLLNRLAHPRSRMHPIRNGVDSVLREHLARDLAVLHRHAVRVARQPQRQQRHVQQAVFKAAQPLQARGPLAAENAHHLLRREAIMSGGHGRVCCKHALRAHRCDVGLGAGAVRPTGKLAFQQRQSQQRGVPFVHVIDVYMQSQSGGHPRPAQAQHNLLLQAIVGVSAVQVIRQPAVPARILIQVRIQQVDGDNMP